MLSPGQLHAASDFLWRLWSEGWRTDELPQEFRPTTRAEGYAVQALVERRSTKPLFGWKIAATSTAGQAHINVDGPLAGRLLAEKAFSSGAALPFGANHMRVAEAEFAFRFPIGLPRRAYDYTLDEVMAAVGSLLPAIEVPDSRFNDFARVGVPQLIADAACACWFVLGSASDSLWRERDLITHAVNVYRNGEPEASGSGANVLGDPRVALTWLVNELRVYGDGIQPGQFVTTGTCVIPVPIAPGDTIRADFGDLGFVETILI